MVPHLSAIFVSLRQSEFFFSLASAFVLLAFSIWKQPVLVPVMNREAVAQ